MGKSSKNFIWSIEVTNIIKGIAILMIVLSHAGKRIPGARILTPLGAVGVGLFLICSGYGLEKSYIKNGLSHYWSKKLYGVYMPWVLIEVIGISFHPQMSILDFMLDLTLVHPLHPFGWYMQYLLIWYAAFYVVKQVFKNIDGGANCLFACHRLCDNYLLGFNTGSKLFVLSHRSYFIKKRKITLLADSQINIFHFDSLPDPIGIYKSAEIIG